MADEDESCVLVSKRDLENLWGAMNQVPPIRELYEFWECKALTRIIMYKANLYTPDPPEQSAERQLQPQVSSCMRFPMAVIDNLKARMAMRDREMLLDREMLRNLPHSSQEDEQSKQTANETVAEDEENETEEKRSMAEKNEDVEHTCKSRRK